MNIQARAHNEPPIAESELIITPSGAIYHLNLRPEQIAHDIIIVGDQNRVKQISRFFDTIEFEVENREFVTHTGYYKGKRISALSTGIGTDNIDIVLNELDALVNIDLNTRKIKQQTTSLNIVRLGTSGALQEDIEVDSFVASSHALGFDGVLGFYDKEFSQEENSILTAFNAHTGWDKKLNPVYIAKGSASLLSKIGYDMTSGITATANGFYGPQGRVLRLRTAFPEINEKLRTFSYEKLRICNYEMETSALFGLGALLDHHTTTVCAIIANRYRKEYSKDYHKTIDLLIGVVLDRLCSK